MNDLISKYVFDWIMSGVQDVVASIGVGGCVLLGCGFLAAAALGFNGLRFLSKPRGLVASAVVVLAGLIFAWWTWPVRGVPEPGRTHRSAAATQRSVGHYAKKETVAKPEKATAATKVTSAVAQSAKQKKPPELLLVPWFIEGAISFLPLPMPSVVSIPHLAPIIAKGAQSVPSKHGNAVTTQVETKRAAPEPGSAAKRPMPLPSKPPVLASLVPPKAAPSVAAGSNQLRPPANQAGQIPSPPHQSVATAAGVNPDQPEYRTPPQQQRENWRLRNQQAEWEFNRWWAGQMSNVMSAPEMPLPHFGGQGPAGPHRAGAHHR